MQQLLSNQFRNHISSYITLDNNDFEQISSCFSLTKTRKGEFLVLPGQICKFEYFILKGLFQTLLADEKGAEHTISFPHENWWTGDFKSFRNRTPSRLTIKGLEESILLRISLDDFNRLIIQSDKFAEYIRILTENNSMAMQERVLDGLSNGVGENYARFLQKFPHLEGRVSQKQMASYLGISPEYFNKVLHSKK